MRLSRNGVSLVVASLTFVFLTIVFTWQSRSWITWYRLAQFGRATQATIILAHPELRRGCSFTYRDESNIIGYASDEECVDKVGQTVSVTYLPNSNSVASLKSPGIQWMLQLGTIVILSVLAGIGGGVYATRKGYVVSPEDAFKLRNLPWSSIALYTSAGAFGCMVVGVAGFYSLDGSRSGAVLLLAAPVLAIVLIVVWLLTAVLTLAFEGQGRKKLIPSLGFVFLWSLGMGLYLVLLLALARIDEGHPHHFHNHPLVQHKKDGVPVPAAGAW
jgi:hypothetical protein